MKKILSAIWVMVFVLVIQSSFLNASVRFNSNLTTSLLNFPPDSPENCDLSGYITYTQGGWGSPSNSTPGKIRDNYFNSVFPGGLVVGINYKLTLTSALAVKNFLPQGGTPNQFTTNYTNPTSTSAGVLGG